MDCRTFQGLEVDSGDDEEDPDAWVPDPIDADPQFLCCTSGRIKSQGKWSTLVQSVFINYSIHNIPKLFSIVTDRKL